MADPYLELAAPAVAVAPAAAPAPSVPSVSVATLKRELALRRAKVAAKVMEVKEVKEVQEVKEVKEVKALQVGASLLHFCTARFGHLCIYPLAQSRNRQKRR